MNRGVFRDYSARFFMNARFVSQSANVSAAIALTLVCTQDHAHN